MLAITHWQMFCFFKRASVRVQKPHDRKKRGRRLFANAPKQVVDGPAGGLFGRKAPAGVRVFS
jgi:hypothetical protein